MLKCPFPNCSYTTESLIAMRIHFTKKHQADPCPICGEKVKNLYIHFANKGRKCKKHRQIFEMLRGKVL